MKEQEAQRLVAEIATTWPGRIQASINTGHARGTYGHSVDLVLAHPRLRTNVNDLDEWTSILNAWSGFLPAEAGALCTPASAPRQDSAQISRPAHRPHSRHRLTTQEISEIRERYGPHAPHCKGRPHGQITIKQLAGEYRVNKATIARVLREKGN